MILGGNINVDGRLNFGEEEDDESIEVTGRAADCPGKLINR